MTPTVEEIWQRLKQQNSVKKMSCEISLAQPRAKPPTCQYKPHQAHADDDHQQPPPTWQALHNHFISHPKHTDDNNHRMLQHLVTAFCNTTPHPLDDLIALVQAAAAPVHDAATHYTLCTSLASLAPILQEHSPTITKHVIAACTPLVTHPTRRVRKAAVECIAALVLAGGHDMLLELTGFRDPNMVSIGCVFISFPWCLFLFLGVYFFSLVFP